MVKGASIKFSTYHESVPQLLNLLQLQKELKKYDKIVIKPFVKDLESNNTSKELLDELLNFCTANKNPVAEIFIAEGVDGEDTLQMFEHLGYRELAEKYSASLLDLNESETEEIEAPSFLRFPTIHYPKILLESFVISLTPVLENDETDMSASLSNMLGAFPASHYKGIFSKRKTKLDKHPAKFAIHDILQCKLPEFAIIDTSEYGTIIAGQPFEVDKQAAKFLGREWKTIPYLCLLDETLAEKAEFREKIEKAHAKREENQ